METRDWQLRLVRRARFLRRLLPSWHRRERAFRDWYEDEVVGAVCDGRLRGRRRRGGAAAAGVGHGLPRGPVSQGGRRPRAAVRAARGGRMMRVVDDAAVGAFERVVHAVDDDSGAAGRRRRPPRRAGPRSAAPGSTPTRARPAPRSTPCASPRAMALKAAAAGLPVGGGKAVIAGDPAPLRCAAPLARLRRGDRPVRRLRTTRPRTSARRSPTWPRCARHTPYVLGLADAGGWDGDPSPLTARGVVAAIRAAWEAETGRDGVRGARVVVQGVGKVGRRGRRPARGRGRAAVDQRRRPGARRRGRRPDGRGRAGTRGGHRASRATCSSPARWAASCAPRRSRRLRCRWVVGVGEQPALRRRGRRACSAARGIGYVPDFVANAGEA